MCEFLDKEENGFIDYRNFITVISDFNKYDPQKAVVEEYEDVVDIPDMSIEEYIMPLNTYMKRNKMNEEQVFT